MTRNNLSIIQNGERIESTINGITIIGANQHVDHNTLIHHKKPNCNSYQDYKGIFGDNSVGVFNGQVMVEKEAQKTNAFQANNNVLTSDKATINTKPQLEIFADDVKCSHGSASGSLDDNSIFYLMSRGLNYKQAKGLLIDGFLLDVIEKITDAEIKDLLKKMIGLKK